MIGKARDLDIVGYQWKKLVIEDFANFEIEGANVFLKKIASKRIFNRGNKFGLRN